MAPPQVTQDVQPARMTCASCSNTVDRDKQTSSVSNLLALAR